MKKVFTLFAFLLITSFAFGQMVEVTFAVDMNGVDGFDPAGGAFVAGEFQSWSPGDGGLDDTDENGVWATTYFLAPGTYRYKFGIGSDWGNNEGGGLADCGVDDNNGGFNRQVTVPDGSGPIVISFVYDDCAESMTSFDGKVEVTFAVNFNDVMGFDPGGGAFVAGEFQGWTPADGGLADGDGNGVWSRVYRLDPGTYLYKFGIGSDWGNNEGGGLADCGIDDNNGGFNRQVVVPDDGTLAMTVNFLYDSCEESELAVNVENISTVIGVEAFPNPMINEATLRFETLGDAAHDIFMTNMNGQIVRQFRGVRGGTVTILRDGLASGLYFITIRNDRGEMGSLKMMVQ